MPRVFLRAEWRKLILVNYLVPPGLLSSRVPSGTELDLWNGKCYVSLVGFRFLNTRLRGIRVPFHVNFEEVNLRFYIRQNLPGGSVRRGVTFIREIVPRPALTFVAKTVYSEPYETLPMRFSLKEENERFDISYSWKKNREHGIRVVAENRLQQMQPGSEEEFITEHYWGYTKLDAQRTNIYAVEHPRWEYYPVSEYNVDVNFGMVYGKEFDLLTEMKPASVMLMEGSEILVRSGQRL